MPAAALREITKLSPTHCVHPTKVDKLDELSEPTVAETEETRGPNLEDTEMYAPAGRGNSYASTRLQRARKKLVLCFVRLIPHCTGLPASKSRSAMSRHVPGRCFTCTAGIYRTARGFGHGFGKNFLYIAN